MPKSLDLEIISMIASCPTLTHWPTMVECIVAIYYKLSEGFVKVYAVLDTRRKPARNDARLDESGDE